MDLIRFVLLKWQRSILHEIRVKANATLFVSYLGYKEREIAVRGRAIIESIYGSYGQSWRACPMNQLLPYETIVKASEGDPEAVAAVLSHYAGYIRSCAKMDG